MPKSSVVIKLCIGSKIKRGKNTLFTVTVKRVIRNTYTSTVYCKTLTRVFDVRILELGRIVLTFRPKRKLSTLYCNLSRDFGVDSV